MVKRQTVTARYASPLGELLLAGDEAGLSGLWFRGARYFAAGLPSDARPGILPCLEEALAWLSRYFAREPLPHPPPLHLSGSPFQLRVWAALADIPYGETVTYGALARRLMQDGRAPAPRAVGGAVGRNPVSLILPCHRVVGADGRLTGYAGGLERKRALLELERARPLPGVRSGIQ